ncbi:hypothetical protein QJQ45_029267 [Haematococcus lacustris]|nr:hypothetical protein QJQ45_029267 [Haematococcus lacustris]
MPQVRVQSPRDLDAMEKGDAYLAGFAERVMRQEFMKKTFGILGLQLALTTLIGAAIVGFPTVKLAVLANPGILLLSFVASFGIMLAFAFSERARNSHPTNLILLFAFTACEGVLVGATSAQYKADVVGDNRLHTLQVVLAFAMTAAVSAGLSLYAVRTKTDFTTMGGFLYSMLLSLLVASLLGVFVKVPMMSLGLGLAGASLFSLYLIYDIQMLMGGNHKYKLSPDEYVLGAITLYLDIINLFLHILQLLSVCFQRYTRMRCARLHLQRQGCSVPHVPLAAAFVSSSDKPRRHALSLSTRLKASEMTTIVVEGAPALLSAADSPSPPAEAPTVPHSTSTGRQSTLQQLKEALAQDLQVMFSGGAINGSIYSKDIVFQDPVTYVVGLDMYKAVISFLGLFNVKLHLHDIHVATDYLITARWTMDMTVKVLPWRPQLSFTGTTQYTVDPDVGYVTQHVDTWDALSNQGFLSLEGLAFVLRQALSLQLTPSIETPEYLVLVKKADYEIRQLSPFLVATTQSGTHSGPASGMGFTTLAGYIFGGNQRGERLEMTTPVFSTVPPGSKSTSMEFVMERRFTDLSQLPEPNDPQNVAKGRFDGGIWAVARFSGWPLDRDVLIAERELRDALCRDGLQAAPGYRLARIQHCAVRSTFQLFNCSTGVIALHITARGACAYAPGVVLRPGLSQGLGQGLQVASLSSRAMQQVCAALGQQLSQQYSQQLGLQLVQQLEQQLGQALSQQLSLQLERRQVIKAAQRGLVEADRPDLSPAQVDAVVAEVNKRMTMGNKQCVLAIVLCLAVLIQSFLAPAQLPPQVQPGIWDPQLLVKIRDAMELLTKASVLEHLMRGPHHRGIRLLPGEVAVFEQPNSAWPVAMLKQLDEVHLTGDNNSLNATATTTITRIQEFYRHPGRLISLWCKAVGVVEGGFTQTGSPPAPTGSSEGGSGIARGFWTFTGVLAILGSVGGALAALLGWFTTSYALALPLVLPVVSLIASLQREGLIAEDNRRKYDSLSSVLHRESSVLLAEARTAIEDVRRELRVQAASSSKLSGMEARLSSLEGSVLSAGRAVREAGTGLAAVPDRLQRELRAQFDAIVTAARVISLVIIISSSSNRSSGIAKQIAPTYGLIRAPPSDEGLLVSQDGTVLNSFTPALFLVVVAALFLLKVLVLLLFEVVKGLPLVYCTQVRSEAMRASMTRSSEEGAALAQLSSQLAALNGALTGLEVAQGEGLRRMTLTLSSNLVDAEAALQALVRTEVERCLEPVRRLPALLASSLPAMLASAQPTLSLPSPTSPYLPQQQQLVPLSEDQLGADQAPGVVLRPGLGQGLGQGLQVASLSSGAMRQVCDVLSQQLSHQYSQQLCQQLSQQLGLQLEQQLEQQLGQALSQQLSLQLGQQLSLQLGQQLGLQLEQQLPALMQQVRQRVVHQWDIEVGVGAGRLPSCMLHRWRDCLLGCPACIAARGKAALLQAAPNAGEVAVARLEGEQWEALGKRLSRMEQLMEGIPRVRQQQLLHGSALLPAACLLVLEARQQSMEEGLGVRLGQLQQEVQGVRQGLEGLLTSTQAMKVRGEERRAERRVGRREACHHPAAAALCASVSGLCSQAQLEVAQAAAAAPWSYPAVSGPFSPPEVLDPDNLTDLQVQHSQQEGGPLQPQLSLQPQQQQQQQRQEQQREWAQQQERQQQQRQEEWAKQLQQQQQEWAHQMDEQQRQAAQQQQEWALQLQGQVVAVAEGQQRQAEGQAKQLQGLKAQLGDLGAALEGMRESLASSSSPAPPSGPTSSQLEAALEQQKQQQVQQMLQQEQALLQLRQQQEALMQQQQAWQQQQQQQLVQQQQAWEQQQKAWEEQQQEREQQQQQQREQQQRKREEQEAREGKELHAMAQGLQGEQASLVQQQLSSLVSEVKVLQVSLTALASGLDTVMAARPQAARAQHSGLEASHLDSSLQQERQQQQQQGREEELSQANMPGSNTSDSSSPEALPHYTAAPGTQPIQQQAAPSTLIDRSNDNSGGSSSGSTLYGSSQGGAESPLRGDDNSLQQQPGSSNGYGSDHSPYSAGSVVAQGRQHSTEQQQQHETQQHQRQLQQQQQQQQVRGLNHQQQQQQQQAARPSEEEQQYQQQEQYQQQQQQQYQQQYQEQEQQQQQAGEGEGGRGYQVADLTRLSEQEVVAEGLRLLRLGREETRKAELLVPLILTLLRLLVLVILFLLLVLLLVLVILFLMRMLVLLVLVQDWGLADRLLSDAVAVFSAALQREPHDTRALGNLGNALLAQGELKQAYLEVLREAPPPAHLQEASVQQAAEAVVRGEAAALLTRSGEMFRQVLELEEWSSRALVNWGRALCIRAELAQEPGMAAKLYQAALSKFEAVLEEDPGMVTARYRAALAMAGLAESSNAQDALLLLQNAAIYLQQVIGSTGPEAEGLRPSATTALANCRQALAAVTTQGTRS